MYVHLGEDTAVDTRDIVAIIDLDNSATSKSTRNFLAAEQKKGSVINVTEELPKSAVICDVKGDKKVYISQLASATLHKRMYNVQCTMYN